MIELPAADIDFTRKCVMESGNPVVDAGQLQTIGKVTKQWTGSEWIDAKALPGQLRGPVAGDIGTDAFGGKTIYDGRQWLSVRDPNQLKEDHFAVEDNDLSMLLNLAGDLVLGDGNMDTAILFGRILERVEGRLNVRN